MGYEEEEDSTEKDTDAYAHESSKSLLEVVLRYELLACLTGRSASVLPAETLQASWTCCARHRTIYYLAAFIHDLTFPEDLLHLKLMVLILSWAKYSIWKSTSNVLTHLLLMRIYMVKYSHTKEVMYE